MPVKVYTSGISGNKEVKKRQQRVMMILDSKTVEYEVIDITEPGREDEKEFMQGNSAAKDNKHPLPPQIFNDEDYCGDYEDFDLANEIDELEKFLKLVPSSADVSRSNSIQGNNVKHNGNSSSREASEEKDTSVINSDGELDERASTAVEKVEDDQKVMENASETRETDEQNSAEKDELADTSGEKSGDEDEEE